MINIESYCYMIAGFSFLAVGFDAAATRPTPRGHAIARLLFPLPSAIIIERGRAVMRLRRLCAGEAGYCRARANTS